MRREYSKKVFPFATEERACFQILKARYPEHGEDAFPSGFQE